MRHTRLNPILAAMVIVSAGCSIDNNQLSMDHSIHVPEEYRIGSNVAGAPSSYGKYITMYDRGWWNCVENYAENINYESIPSDSSGNGTPASILGYKSGYQDAEKRIKRWIRHFGKDKTQAFLRDVLNPL